MRDIRPDPLCDPTTVYGFSCDLQKLGKETEDDRIVFGGVSPEVRRSRAR